MFNILLLINQFYGPKGLTEVILYKLWIWKQLHNERPEL